MTRPAMRMCARCQAATYEPVLVHEVHAATGPGFNVYACPECATHYPPLRDPLDLREPTHSRSRLTIRVYRIDTTGMVTADSGRLEVLAGGHLEPVSCTSAFPPCACPQCRTPR